MLGCLTLLANMITLAAVSWTCWSIHQSGQRMKQTHAMIEAYRREIGWLTERVEMLEHATQVALKFKA